MKTILILLSCLVLTSQAQNHQRGSGDDRRQGPPQRRSDDISVEYGKLMGEILMRVADSTGASRSDKGQEIRNLQDELARCTEFRSTQYYIDCARKNSLEILDLALKSKSGSTKGCMKAYVKNPTTALWRGDGENWASIPSTGRDCTYLSVADNLRLVLPNPVENVNIFRSTVSTMYKVTAVDGTCAGATGFVSQGAITISCQ